MKRPVHADNSDAVFIGEFHAGVHRAVCDGLTELLVCVPDACGLEPAWPFFDLRARHAAAYLAAEQLIEMQRLDSVVRADAVFGCGGAKPCSVGGFVRRVATMPVGCL